MPVVGSMSKPQSNHRQRRPRPGATGRRGRESLVLKVLPGTLHVAQPVAPEQVGIVGIDVPAGVIGMFGNGSGVQSPT